MQCNTIPLKYLLSQTRLPNYRFGVSMDHRRNRRGGAAGDCRVVVNRGGAAPNFGVSMDHWRSRGGAVGALTSDHRPSRQDEKQR
ncbi:hypothetical protein E3N88_37485 [Mikania micrantha]|uniref:Uncharacterized protein n=1 Tax=Mikania micrantha TaxID=192012 RepID=A0A5N6LRB0_9ASTR|nr:hypothetical protein E3N88_37485 [Mikania micrantha]